MPSENDASAGRNPGAERDPKVELLISDLLDKLDPEGTRYTNEQRDRLMNALVGATERKVAELQRRLVEARTRPTFTAGLFELVQGSFWRAWRGLQIVLHRTLLITLLLVALALLLGIALWLGSRLLGFFLK